MSVDFLISLCLISHKTKLKIKLGVPTSFHNIEFYNKMRKVVLPIPLKK